MINVTNNNFNINNRVLWQWHPRSDSQSTCAGFVILRHRVPKFNQEDGDAHVLPIWDFWGCPCSRDSATNHSLPCKVYVTCLPRNERLGQDRKHRKASSHYQRLKVRFGNRMHVLEILILLLSAPKNRRDLSWRPLPLQEEQAETRG